MKLLFFCMALAFVCRINSFAQGEMNNKGEPVAKNAQDAPVDLKAGETIK